MYKCEGKSELNSPYLIGSGLTKSEEASGVCIADSLVERPGACISKLLNNVPCKEIWLITGILNWN